ncbi:site-specific integrase [Mycobacterium sp. D16Q13]|nr:site-specific integrase [Mycobacterium sp. D16Q13]
MNNKITLGTTIRDLWINQYRPYLVKQGRAQNTLDAYDRKSERFIERFGSRRLSEVPTTVLEAYLADLADKHGPGSAKTCRSALSGMFRYAIRISSGAVSVNPVRRGATRQGR